MNTRIMRETAICVLALIAFATPALCGNIAPSARANASSDYWQSIHKINDGNYVYPDGAWCSLNEEPHWIYLVWDEERTISGVKVFFPEQGKEKDPSWGVEFAATVFSIQVLKKDADPDKEDSWSTTHQVSDNANSTCVFEFDQGVTTKGVRLYITEASQLSSITQEPSFHGARVKEIEVWEGEMPVTPVAPVDSHDADVSGKVSLYPYPQIENPLFEELLSNIPGPDKVLYWGYSDLHADPVHRPYGKQFGHRYVQREEEDELKSMPVVPIALGWQRGGVGSYPTMRMILRPDADVGAPKVIGENPWIMDPRWQEAYLKSAVKLAEASLDDSPGNVWGNTWGLMAGDETWEAMAIHVVPVEKRYDLIFKIDEEIKRDYGFGKYGIPESQEDKDPFRRIAFRRWANDKLTELFKETYLAVKKINPNLVMFGPDPCGGAPPVDMEAMSPYFDLISSQSWYSPTPYVQQLATGCDTKAMTDLSSCAYWGLPQHALAHDPETIREQCSQVFRNGGQGLVVLGADWYDRELEHPKFTNPVKWLAYKEIIDTVTQMNKVKLPKPDTAVLYASDTMLTFDHPKMASAEHRQMYSAYAALGPGVGSWFSFVSDRQIERGIKKLSDYKVLYIPLATYERSIVLTKVEEYVKEGGVVVCTDPTAFTWNIDGTDTSEKWLALAGVRKGSGAKSPKSASTVDGGFLKNKEPVTFALTSDALDLSPAAPGVEVFARFDDGTPAATIRNYGKGKIVLFASDPFVSPDRNVPMEQMVRAIQQSVGAKTDHDIWRFKLPPLKTVDMEDAESHQCLTNNNVVMVAHQAKSVHNLSTQGTYTYDHAPTGYSDSGKSGEEISFVKGHLTNRKLAYVQRDRSGDRNPVELEKWIVSWTDPAPVKVTFDLKSPYSLNRVKLFYSGALPALRTLGSRDGVSWTDLSSTPAKPSTSDVLDASLSLNGEFRYVRLDFAAREEGQALELSEVEIWGDPLGGR